MLAAGKKVAVVERELIGGECAYWTCIPSKTLLWPPEARSEASRALGTGTLTLDLEEVFDYRDSMIRNLDDSDQVKSYEEKDATAIKGDAVRGRRDGLLPGLRRRWWEKISSATSESEYEKERSNPGCRTGSKMVFTAGLWLKEENAPVG